MPACFISFEGIDGSGKSTQAKMLAQALMQIKQEVILTREPGGSIGGEEIRRLVLEGDKDRWSNEVELLLFTAARLDHLEKLIVPALNQGKIVICDRFVDSTRVYQGLNCHDGLNPDQQNQIDALHELMIKVEPDLTFLIDIDAHHGLKRAFSRSKSKQELRFEQKGIRFMEQKRQGFLNLAQCFRDRIHVINGARSQQEIADEIYTITLEKLKI